MSKLKTEVQIREKLKELETQEKYLREFMTTLYKGSDLKEKIEREMKPLQREINIVNWILDDNLPF
ncbi:MAG: hypothetical protein U9O94_07030 [Nanoarchaeota archaeon]|nr:hypothetical protein [Nanoarchaeota archaeon]